MMNYVKSKVTLVCKLLFLLSAVTINVYIVLSNLKVINPYDIETSNKTTRPYENAEISALGILKAILKVGEPRKKSFVYILLWTYSKTGISLTFDENNKCFLKRNCTFNNCFVTYYRDYLGDYTKFDVIIFIGSLLDINDLPEKRRRRQIYVYGNLESAENYPVCDKCFDNFFNWTWTYKLDSTIRWGYITVTDMKGEIVGPKKEMHWIRQKDMKSVKDNFKVLLKTKTKAAAWFASNCNSTSHREIFAKNLEKELGFYNLSLDTFGYCGKQICEPNRGNICNKLIARDYYFYLSFENAFSEDYVTEKILYPLQFNAIPVVFGGANYTRFLPDGVYLNANELGVKKLAALMNRLIHNKKEYYEYFKWKNHYQYFGKGEHSYTDDYCELCAAVNNNNLVKKETIVYNFTNWWSKTNSCVNYIPPAKKLESPKPGDGIKKRLFFVYFLSFVVFIALRYIVIVCNRRFAKRNSVIVMY